jgi:hypothetical protein
MKRKSFAHSRTKFYNRTANNLKIVVEPSCRYTLSLTTDYRLYHQKEAFNSFLHNCTNYDEILSSVCDHESSAMKILLKQKAKKLIYSF